jgi:lipopolysaccharide transport system permease protein
VLLSWPSISLAENSFMISTQHEVVAPTAQEEHTSFADQRKDFIFQKISKSQLALEDFIQGVLKWPVAFALAYQSISVRYRRSILGPFWLTLSMAITIYSMGFLYARLFHTELQHYFPTLCAGMLTWSLIAALVTETTDGFTTPAGLIKQLDLPYTLHIHCIVTRNMIIFFHNILVIIPILLIFHEYAKINWCTLLIIPGLAIIYLNGLFYGTVLAIIGARYRDVSQVIKSSIQVFFFLTPVMWEPSILSERTRFYIDLNPFYALIQIIRAPLLGKLPTLNNLIVITAMTLIGAVLSFKLMARCRARIVYWL